MEAPCLFQPLGQEENWLMAPTQTMKWNPAGTEQLSWLSCHLPPHSQKLPSTSADRNSPLGSTQQKQQQPLLVYFSCACSKVTSLMSKQGLIVDCLWLSAWDVAQLKKKRKKDWTRHKDWDYPKSESFMLSIQPLHLWRHTHTLFLHSSSQPSISFHQPEKAHWLNSEAIVNLGKLDSFFSCYLTGYLNLGTL